MAPVISQVTAIAYREPLPGHGHARLPTAVITDHPTHRAVRPPKLRHSRRPGERRAP
ncbi:hypothetical protein BJV74DRAFT_827758 [Russula compacta]|nr:hypothetical protein BJV74DRAFT_827758 [Russula compacta]